VGSHIYRPFPAKRLEFWTHVVLLLYVRLDFDFKEPTEAYSDLRKFPQQLKE
jgi:hypothetical protein